MTSTPVPRGLGGWLRSGAVVLVGSGIGNAAGLLLLVVSARWLGPDEYSAFAAVLGVLAVLMIPCSAVQMVVARANASGKGIGFYHSAIVVVAVVTGAVAVAATPLVTKFLGLGSGWYVFWVALAAVPMVFAGAFAGKLLGAERFGRFGLGQVLMFVPKFVVMLLVLAGVRSIGTLTFWLFAFTLACTLLLALLADVHVRKALPKSSLIRPGLVAIGLAAVSIAGIMVLSVTDLLATRVGLSAGEAGLYAAGTSVTRVFIFGPQFISIVVFPTLVKDVGRRSTWVSVAVMAGVGMLGVGLVGVFGSQLTLVIGGPQYESIAGFLWIFAAIGLVQAIIELLMLRGLARRHYGALLPIWVGVPVEAILIVVWARSCEAAAVVALTVTSLVLAAVALITMGQTPHMIAAHRRGRVTETTGSTITD